MVIRTEVLTLLEFAAGTGMLGEAVCAAFDAIGIGCVPVCYVEREASAAASIVALLEAASIHEAVIWDDVRTFDPLPWSGLIDVVAAGYPCQPFSAAGKRLGSEDPRHLWPAIRQHIVEIEPQFVFIENVDGHVSCGFDAVALDLETIGYHVEAGVFCSEEVGGSHLRKRLFILGIMADYDSRRCWRKDCEVPTRGNPVVHVSDKLANSHITGLEGRGSPEPGGDRVPVSIGGELGNTYGPGCERRGNETYKGRERPHLRRRELAHPEGGDGVVPSRNAGDAADPERGGERDIPLSSGVIGGTLPFYPPHRTSYWSWVSIAMVDQTRMPAVEPEVRRVADGLAPATEQLRCVGNGVDPLVATVAFTSLLSCAVNYLGGFDQE